MKKKYSNVRFSSYTLIKILENCESTVTLTYILFAQRPASKIRWFNLHFFRPGSDYNETKNLIITSDKIA